MTPVLVFLTDKTLYVTDLVRNRLCNKFVLPYSELDIILVNKDTSNSFNFSLFFGINTNLILLIDWTTWKYGFVEQ